MGISSERSGRMEGESDQNESISSISTNVV